MFSTSSEIAKVLMLKSNILTLHSKTCKKIRYYKFRKWHKPWHFAQNDDINALTLRHGDFERNFTAV